MSVWDSIVRLFVSVEMSYHFDEHDSEKSVLSFNEILVFGFGLQQTITIIVLSLVDVIDAFLSHTDDLHFYPTI